MTISEREASDKSVKEKTNELKQSISLPYLLLYWISLNHY
jgi:hypothetical protein